MTTTHRADREVVIIGSGPAGLTAALYAARANLHPLLIEGLEAGGQLMLTTMVENWPGFRDGIMGPDLMGEMRAQAERFGTEVLQGNVTSVDLQTRPFTIMLEGGRRVTTASLIIATGASAKCAPRAANSRASACASATGAVLQSTTIWSGRAWASSSVHTTRTSGSPGRDRKTTSARETSRTDVSALWTRSQDTTGRADLTSRFRHMGAPITPRPMNPSSVAGP